MICRILGLIVRRYWFFLLLGWGLLVFVSWRAAPPWPEVTQDQDSTFLPQDAPSRRAAKVFAKAFPDHDLTSNIVLVLHRDDHEPGHLDRDLKFIDDILQPGLWQIAAAEGGLASEPVPSEEPLFGQDSQAAKPSPRRSIIDRIQTPSAPGAGALLVSPDRQALLVVLQLTTAFRAPANWPTIAQVEQLVSELQRQGKVPQGLAIALTGSAVIGRDYTMAQMQSVRATHLLTVLLVIGLLILIYRAPLLALIPLATVYLAVQVARNCLAILAGAGYLMLFPGIEIYITILAYGAGVDYSLFLTARYKEELDRGAAAAEAVAGAVCRVGPALVASAATVICGLGMMFFARFGKFHDAGLAIPFSLVLVLAASLTFSPALLRLAGRWAFWPQPLGMTTAAAPETGLLRWLFRPGALGQFWEKIGELLLRRAGTVCLITVVLMAPFAVAAGLHFHQMSYDLVSDLPADSPAVAGTQVLQDHFPAGVIGPVTVLLVNPHVSFAGPEGMALVAQLTEQLHRQANPLDLADIRSLSAPLGLTRAAAHGVASLHLSKEARQEAIRAAALQHYVTDLGGRRATGTRLDLILQGNPFSRQSIEDLDRIEQTITDDLPDGLRQETQLYVGGTTASVRDLADVVLQDRTRIELLVLGSVLLILVVLLRGLVVPLYLLLSVLFSYFTTLGVAFAVFWLADPHGFAGLDWKVGIFLFTILIAVGEDYNIFLLTRLHEEQGRHGRVRGIVEALTRTGPIISSCGIIMAGTFASLLGGSLLEMKQLGFALSFGVLLDTFVVRPILVPAFLLLQSGRLSLRAGAERRFRGWVATAGSGRTTPSS